MPLNKRDIVNQATVTLFLGLIFFSTEVFLRRWQVLATST